MTISANPTLEELQKIMDKNNGSLYLERSAITTLPDNLIVEGSLFLSNTAITSLPDNLKVGDLLYLSNTAITSLPDNLTVGGSLDLERSAITSLPDNLTVGGSLYLSGSAITSLPDNLTVGGSLDLSNTAITSLPDNLKVGGLLYLRETAIKNSQNYKGHNVVSDGTNYAHCDNFRDGIADLLFKTAAERGAEQFKNLTLNSFVTLDEAKTMYRIITGACRAGTEQFVNSLPELKESYTIREMLEITRGQYNSKRFAEFFGEEQKNDT